MPSKKENLKKTQRKLSDTPQEEQAESDPATYSDEDKAESSQNNDLEFMSNDQVLWFRNIIRAQGKHILNEMFQEKCRKLNEENERLKQWVKSETEGMLKMLTDLKEDNREKQRRIERLEYENRKKDEIIRELNTKYDELEQRRYDKDVQVVGLPESNNDEEDQKKILKLSKDEMGIKLKGADIEGFHRLGKKTEKKSRDIIITFKEKKTREAFYEQRKKTSQSKVISQNIYVNDHLTDFRKGLFYRARQLVKHKKLYMTWTQKGNILVRKEESGKVIQVTNYSVLKSLTEDPEHLPDEYPVGALGSSEVSSTCLGDMMSHISDYDYDY